VPKVTGKPLAAAKRLIAQNHCRTGAIRYASSRKVVKGRVITQSLRPGRIFVEYTKIKLVISRGRP
jgi:beta-lactam-binding protein with PASTA domain